MFTCEEKIAFVTGGLGVIGLAYIKFLFKNNIKGVAIIDIQEINSKDLMFDATKIIYIKADVSKKEELKNAFEKTIKRFGQLDIVINNAGVVNEENYELCVNINFIAVMNGTEMALREFLPKYKKSSGVIVNTASIAGIFPYVVPVYSITKHAVVSIGLCNIQNEICKKEDIRVLTICPAATQSPLLSGGITWLKDHDNEEEAENLQNSAKNADYLGEGLIKIMKEGQNGSVWMFVEGKKPYVVNYDCVYKGAAEYVKNVNSERNSI